MTPQPALQPGTAADTHLTEEQFGELLARSAAASAQSASNAPALDVSLAEAHLRTCEPCAAELASLRQSLALFRDASSAYADKQLRSLPQWFVPVRRPAQQLAYWAAAAAILLASILPLQLLRRPAPSPRPAVAASESARPAETDEALLEDVSREISEAVPTPMQALADPTANMATSVQNSTQRKD